MRGLVVLQSSVPETWRFDTEPDQRIRTSGTGLQIRKLLFFHWLSRWQKFIFTSFFAYYTLGTGTFTSVFKDNKV
jgi:hypothetical protein